MEGRSEPPKALTLPVITLHYVQESVPSDRDRWNNSG